MKGNDKKKGREIYESFYLRSGRKLNEVEVIDMNSNAFLEIKQITACQLASLLAGQPHIQQFKKLTSQLNGQSTNQPARLEAKQRTCQPVRLSDSQEDNNS